MFPASADSPWSWRGEKTPRHRLRPRLQPLRAPARPTAARAWATAGPVWHARAPTCLRRRPAQRWAAECGVRESASLLFHRIHASSVLSQLPGKVLGHPPRNHGYSTAATLFLSRVRPSDFLEQHLLASSLDRSD